MAGSSTSTATVTAFVTGGDAFLARDRNGAVDDGTELFGEHHGAADGFAELRRFDDNGDLVIDPSDAVFGDLFLFDGDSLRRLADAGVISISTLMGAAAPSVVSGNEIIGSSQYLTADGRPGTVAEVLLNYYA